ncbi:MAG: carbohydrate kinase family protein [Candidatus Zixiibacteriota bacterium]|nr:MAG: carbohydrate kinase family protein [candidate division Zixibacteria bacterium]
MSKIGIIGTINRDSVRLADGTFRKGWGGILYNIRTFSQLLGDDSIIIPACKVGADCHGRIMAILNSLPQVRTDLIQKTPGKNNHCFLTYTDIGNKQEVLAGGVSPLKYTDVAPLQDCEMILVNYISGRDIYTRSLQKLRRHYCGEIYIDIHSLTLGKRRDGSRFLRTPPAWWEVIAAGDFIQVNRLELVGLTGSVAAVKSDQNEIKKRARRFFELLGERRINCDNKVLIITDGGRGCYLSYRGKMDMKFRHVPTLRTIAYGDTTGCGDCFSAGFIAGWLTSRTLVFAAREANRAGQRRILGTLG